MEGAMTKNKLELSCKISEITKTFNENFKAASDHVQKTFLIYQYNKDVNALVKSSENGRP